jgi:hypothetical protein
MDLSGHTILIVEPNVTPFTARLRAAIEREGAVNVLVRTAADASHRIKQSRFSAAVLKADHRALAEELGIQYVLYTPSEPPATIIAELARLLVGPAEVAVFRADRPATLRSAMTARCNPRRRSIRS